jgi:hypothetical protein
MDALAADSVIFDRAYAHSPLTLPSTVSLLSGLLPFQSGVRDEVGFAVPASIPLLPQLLHRRGFKTGGVVSSCQLNGSTGLAAAFGFYDDQSGDPTAPDAPPRCARDGAETRGVAEHWMESVRTSRFFLYLELDGRPAAAGTEARGPRVTPYDARIAYADELVGRLVEFLKKHGLYSGGIVILTSDHGEGLGDHGEQGHGLLLYEAIARTPLIVKLPRRDGGGRHSAALVEQVDVVPTVLDLVGAPTPSKIPGRSLRRILDSPTATISDRAIYAETYAPRFLFGWSEVASLTTRRYRYISSARPELYDLESDPDERMNLAGKDTETAERMRTSLEALLRNSPPPVPAAAEDQDRGRVAAIGRTAGLPDVPPGTPGRQLPDPKDLAPVASRYFEAIRLADEGRADEAIAACQAVVAEAPTLAPAWDRLASLLAVRGRYREAGEALASLLALYPEDGRAAEADRRVRSLLGAEPTAEQFAVAVRVLSAVGEKARAAEVRAAGRKAVGDAALRRAEAALPKR